MTIAERLRFSPSAGNVIRRPGGSGYGYWVGGHKVSYDATTETFVLFYRTRAPLEHGRGGRCAVAVSDDGITFNDVWLATKDELDASSIEVGHCLRGLDGSWRLYVSYERAGTATWRIDVLEGTDPAQLDTQGRRTALSPSDFGLPWIKDPFVVVRDGTYWLYAAVPGRTPPQVDGNVVHAAPEDATVVATSDDGRYFPKIEYVFEAPADDSWHGRRARLNSVFPLDDGWVATYDGGRTFYDNYEEWAGLATSPDGKQWARIATEAGPWVRSPHGCVRYVYGLPHQDRILFYYEYTLPDGSHDLRVSVVRPA